MKISETSIEAINKLEPSVLLSHGMIRLVKNKDDEYICPFCENGSGSDATGIKPKIEESHVGWRCFKCEENFNNIKIIAKHYGLSPQSDFREVVEKACEQFNISLACDTSKKTECIHDSAKAREEQKQKAAKLKFIRDDLNSAPETLKNFVASCGGTWRGFDADFLLKFGCRFIPKWTSPESRVYKTFSTPTPRLLIPCSAESYLARLTCSVDKFDESKQKFIKPKQHTGTKTLFNPDALKFDGVFCFESYLEAMSAELAGYPAVATGGADNGKCLVDAVLKLKNKPRIILFFDSDETGRDAAPKLQVKLQKVGCRVIVKFLTEDISKLDVNDLLQKNGVEELRRRLGLIFDEAQAEFEVLEKESANDDVASSIVLTAEELDFYFSGAITDLGNARRLERFCADKIKWLSDDEKFLIWEGTVWRKTSKENHHVLPFVFSLADLLIDNSARVEDEKNKRRARAIAYSFQDQKKYNPAISALKGISSIRITSKDLNTHSNLLCVQNGVVDLQTGKLFDADPKLLLTQQVNAFYDEKADCTAIEKFFADIMPDVETRAGLIRWLGYCLTGETSEEKFMIWHGSGANGKGVLSKLLLVLLNSYASSLPSRALMRNRRGADANQATTSLNPLESVRFAISEELPADGELDCSLIKNLTGGDKISLRRNYGEFRDLENFAKINISGNYRPAIENINDYGLLRRLLNMPFTVTFKPGVNLDPNLKRLLLQPENLRGLLKILVDAAKNWYQDGLIVSRLMQKETTDHLNQNNFIMEFIEENDYVLDENLPADKSVKARDFIDDLKNNYYASCDRFNRKDLIVLIENVASFVEYTKDNHNSRVFKGIGKPPTHGFGGTKVNPKDFAMP